MRRPLRRCAAVGVAAVAVLACTPQATAQDVGERITSYDVSMRVGDDGSMTVEETVDYDFGVATDKHGFYRDLVTRMDYDRYNYRHYPVDDIEVSSPTGAPDDLSVEKDDTSTRIRIGDADETVTGTQTYTITYRVKGVLNGFSDHVELYWNVLGTGFDVPIDSATAKIETPGDDVTRVACYAGPQGSKSPCAGKTMSAATASFTADSVDADDAFTVVVGMPKGTATATPILTERPSWRTDFGPGIANIAGVVLAAATAVLLWLLLRRKRREHAADAQGAAPATGSGVLRQQPDGSVTFVSPGGLRPGQVGTLYDDKADTIDVTATIVDLAVRGYLVIDELPDGDWGLRMLKVPGPEFLPYERMFFDALFLGKPDRVRMSDLRNKFAATLGSIKELMYSDMAQRAGSPAASPVRSRRSGGCSAVSSAASAWSSCGASSRAPTCPSERPRSPSHCSARRSSTACATSRRRPSRARRPTRRCRRSATRCRLSTSPACPRGVATRSCRATSHTPWRSARPTSGPRRSRSWSPSPTGVVAAAACTGSACTTAGTRTGSVRR